MHRRCAIASALILITLAVFWQVQDHGFVWDDTDNVERNPYLSPATLSSVIRFWQKPYENLYVPLTYTVWAAIARSAASAKTNGLRPKPDPRPFHVANLVLHLLSALVVFTTLRMLVRNDWAACAGALLFAVHPVQVEPVAWITGMKDVLSGLLSLAAVWQYLAYAIMTCTPDENPAGRSGKASVIERDTLSFRRKDLHYALATLAFVLALLAKPAAVVVPAIAWALDYWVLRRPVRESAVALIGWVAAATPFVVWTKSAQPDAMTDFITPLWARPFVATDAAAFYLYKLAVPLWLGPDYGRSSASVLREGWLYVTWILPCGLAIVIWLWRDRRPWLVASAGVFVAGILPVSGLIPFSFQNTSTVADRYLYFAMLGPALTLAWFLSQHRGNLVAVICGLILVSLGIKSAFQTAIWRDSLTLWTHAVTITPHSYFARYNLANALSRSGRIPEAIAQYRRSLELDPIQPEAHYNLGNIFGALGKPAEAIAHYQASLEIDANQPKVRLSLGNVLVGQGQYAAAVEQYRKALQVRPNHAETHNNLGVALAEQGKTAEAAVAYRQAIRLEPSLINAYNNLGNVLLSERKFIEAAAAYQEALKLKPNYAHARFNLARLYLELNQREAALEQQRILADIEPNMARRLAEMMAASHK